MNILITGSSGFIGTNLALFLKKELVKKCKIYLLDKKINKYYNFNNFIKLDLKNISKLDKVIKKKKINLVIHLAAISGVKHCHENPKMAMYDNVISSFNLLSVAKKNNVNKVLIASSFSVNNFILNPSYYGFTKYTVENLAYSFNKNFNLNVSVLRFSNVFGSFSKHKISAVHNFIKNSIRNKPLLIHGTGKQSRDFIHVSDLVKKILKIIKSKKIRTSYNINTNHYTSILSIVDAIDDISGKKNKVQFIKPPEGYNITPTYNRNKINKKLYNYLQNTYNWYRQL